MNTEYSQLTYVFINIENTNRIKMIEAYSLQSAKNKLTDRLRNEPNSGLVSDYNFSYYL